MSCSGRALAHDKTRLDAVGSELRHFGTVWDATFVPPRDRYEKALQAYASALITMRGRDAVLAHTHCSMAALHGLLDQSPQDG